MKLNCMKIKVWNVPLIPSEEQREGSCIPVLLSTLLLHFFLHGSEQTESPSFVLSVRRLPDVLLSPTSATLTGLKHTNSQEQKNHKAAGKQALTTKKLHTHARTHSYSGRKPQKQPVHGSVGKIKRSTTRGEEMRRGSTEQTMF